jgi:hypothetical protein
VQSKFFFDECPEDFPFAYEVPLHQQRSWAISKSKFRASGFTEEEKRGVAGYRCGQYREASPSWSYRGTFLQRLCLYTSSGAHFSTYNCREYLAVYPSLVTVSGWKSSYTQLWYRLGTWVIAGPEQVTETGERTPAFQFQGLFTLAEEKPKFLASVGEGRLEVDGEDVGVFRALNLSESPVPDWEATTLGLENVADPQQCYVVNFRIGMLERRDPEFRLLQKARELREWLAARKDGAVDDEEGGDEQRESPADSASASGQKRGRGRSSGSKTSRRRSTLGIPRRRRTNGGSNGSLVISEYDYSNLGRAAYVCRRPEGVFTADDLADRFDDYGVDQVMAFDVRHRIPAEVAVIVGRRKKKGVEEYRVRWQGYGEFYDTWEPEEHLGAHATDAREQFLQNSVATDDEN